MHQIRPIISITLLMMMISGCATTNDEKASIAADFVNLTAGLIAESVREDVNAYNHGVNAAYVAPGSAYYLDAPSGTVYYRGYDSRVKLARRQVPVVHYQNRTYVVYDADAETAGDYDADTEYFDAEVPDVNIDTTVPDVNIDTTVPDVNIDTTVPDVNINTTVPDVNIDTTVPDVNIDTTVPDVNIDTTVPDVPEVSDASDDVYCGMDEAQFMALKSALENGEGINKNGSIPSLSAEQATALLLLVADESQRIEIAVAMYGFVCDKENWYQVYEAIPSDEGRVSLEEGLSQRYGMQ